MEIITEKLTNSPSMGEGSREPTDVFQRDFVKGVVSEAMQEWCDSIEKRMWGLQYSLLRQMQHQQVVSVSLYTNIRRRCRGPVSSGMFSRPSQTLLPAPVGPTHGTISGSQSRS